MSQLAVYGAVASVPTVVQLDVPAGARSKVTSWMFVSPSEAVALSETPPASGVPGSSSETEGSPVSTLAVAVTVLETLPTLSAMVKV
ncbi:MAG TPA: hypothetical protein VF891_00355 [Gaiellaceae bacterium]